MSKREKWANKKKKMQVKSDNFLEQKGKVVGLGK